MTALLTVFLRTGFFTAPFLLVLLIMLPAVSFLAALAALETRVVPAEMDPRVAPIVRATVSRAPSSFVPLCFALDLSLRFVFTFLLRR